MVPSGDATETIINKLVALFESGDILVSSYNSSASQAQPRFPNSDRSDTSQRIVSHHGKEMMPSRVGERKNFARVVPSLFTITLPACDKDVAGNVKASAIAVHAVKMFDRWPGFGQPAEAVWALVLEPFPHQSFVFLAVYPRAPVLRELATQIVEEHADQFVGDVGLGASGGRAQQGGRVGHLLSPSSHSTSTPSALASPFSS
jgi:hypothetical protein